MKEAQPRTPQPIDKARLTHVLSKFGLRLDQMIDGGTGAVVLIAQKIWQPVSDEQAREQVLASLPETRIEIDFGDPVQRRQAEAGIVTDVIKGLSRSPRSPMTPNEQGEVDI